MRSYTVRMHWVPRGIRSVPDQSTTALVESRFVSDDLFFETSPMTRKARNLARNPAAVVHTESGDEVVIVHGHAKPFDPRGEVAADIVREFAQKYNGYQPDPIEWTEGSLYRVEPTVVFAWRDMPTATCWRFR